MKKYGKDDLELVYQIPVLPLVGQFYYLTFTQISYDFARHKSITQVCSDYLGIPFYSKITAADPVFKRHSSR